MIQQKTYNRIAFKMSFQDLCEINGRDEYYFLDTFICKTNMTKFESVVITLFSMN